MLTGDRAGMSHVTGPLVAVVVSKLVDLIGVVIPASIGNGGK